MESRKSMWFFIRSRDKRFPYVIPQIGELPTGLSKKDLANEDSFLAVATSLSPSFYSLHLLLLLLLFLLFLFFSFRHPLFLPFWVPFHFTTDSLVKLTATHNSGAVSRGAAKYYSFGPERPIFKLSSANRLPSDPPLRIRKKLPE